MRISNLLSFSILLVASALIFSSCKMMFPNRMFKQGNYEYFQQQKPPINQYVIQPGDQITLQIYARQGFDLIDVLRFDMEAGQGGGGGNRMMRQGTSGGTFYLVEHDGYVELPVLGRVYAQGFTEKELEELIEKKSSVIFNEPFAILRVNNRRAFVFLGASGSVIPLNQAPTTLIEVLALSGGLSRDMKAYKIKVLRGDLKNPEIIDIDLSTIAGLQKADLIIQTNDIVYVEDRLRITRTALGEITPVLSLTTTMISFILLMKNL
jgi:polysaccharide biosynthesis/export protein